MICACLCRFSAATAVIATLALPTVAVPLERYRAPEAQSSAPLAAATPAPVAPTTDVSILPDGAHVVILSDPTAKETVVDIFFKVGQSDEGRWPGINALITRSWISASDNRSALQLQGDIARAGAAVGTSSAPEWTELWGACAPDYDSFAKLTQMLLSHVVSEPLFEESAVALARSDQLRSIAVRRDKLLMDVMDEMQSRAYGDSAYGLPLLGTASSLAELPWAQVGAYYRRYFRPERAVIVIAGNVKIDEAKTLVLASIDAGNWDEARPPHAPRETLASVSPIPAGLRAHTVTRYAPAACVAEGYLAPGTDTRTGAADYATLLVLDAVLGGGKASRLFALRDLATESASPVGYEVRSVLIAGRAQSLWAVYVIGDQSPESIEAKLHSVLSDLATGAKPIADAELSHAKTYLKARHLQANERIKGRAYGAGWSEVMGLGAQFDASYDALIDAVTSDDVAAMAHRVFSGNPAIAHSLLHSP